MNKMIVLLAVLAMTGCAEAVGDVALIGGGAARAGGGGDDLASAPARLAAREVAPREITARRERHHDAEFVVCAQCRR